MIEIDARPITPYSPFYARWNESGPLAPAYVGPGDDATMCAAADAEGVRRFHARLCLYFRVGNTWMKTPGLEGRA